MEFEISRSQWSIVEIIEVSVKCLNTVLVVSPEIDVSLVAFPRRG